jgi:pyruvate dehydrogenase E2 component (dihydrolipoamide acetyltransferase)
MDMPDLPHALSSAATPPARLFASPAARALARTAGLSLQGLRGSGPAGRIVRADVQAALDAPAARAPQSGLADSAWEAPPGSQALPLSPVRRAIARRMSDAMREAPHFYLEADLDAGPMMATRAARAGRGEPVPSVGACVLRAVALALQDEPALNAWLQGDRLVQHAQVDLSVAMDVDGTLLMPVLRQAAGLPAAAISQWLRDTRTRASQGPLPQGSSRGGGFAVSNLGGHGVRRFSAILQPPQVGILAVGQVVQQPVVRDGALAVGEVLGVTLSVDHRAIDGATAARWLQALRRRLESPETHA